MGVCLVFWPILRLVLFIWRGEACLARKESFLRPTGKSAYHTLASWRSTSTDSHFCFSMGHEAVALKYAFRLRHQYENGG
jgi:hypothetical protein